ncbi:MAG: T9SS type A sorting domain-containing protein [Bacteroidales bacterium]|nr:T9SS type A sorting domain-containing protein [Bacteroidales bacterium]
MKHLSKYLLIAFLCLVASQNRIFSQTYLVDTIQYQGDVDYPINLVILGDGFLVSELPVFRDSAESYINLLFTVDPFSRFKSFFNAFSISVPSNEQGAAMHPDTLIDNYFGSTFNYAGIERLLVPTNNTRITNVLANNFPEYDQVFMLVNSTKYGGSGGWVATASLHEDSKEILLHELGHSFANLADEYWAGIQYAREAINMTQETDLEKLRWRNWYGDNNIGLYSHAESTSWYRPHQNCIMRYLGEPFCAVCREGLIESIYALASPFKGYEPGITTFHMSSDSVLFKVELTHPEPTSLVRVWYLNDEMIGENVDSITVRFTELKDGRNKVIASVTDTSSWIRPYEDETYHKTEVEWVVYTWGVGSEQQIKIFNHSAISIYPNPVYDYLNVKILGEQIGEVFIELYDSQGRQIKNSIIQYPGRHSLEMSNLEAGLYMIRISMDGNYLSSRIIIKH